jgi:hypothetical protein
MQVIRSHNTPNRVTLVDGTIIDRDPSGKIFIPEYGTFIPTAPYDNQFIFEVPQRIKTVSHMCSCGSPAVIVGAKAYAHLGSSQDALFVCYHHTSYNKHADGSA